MKKFLLILGVVFVSTAAFADGRSYSQDGYAPTPVEMTDAIVDAHKALQKALDQEVHAAQPNVQNLVTALKKLDEAYGKLESFVEYNTVLQNSRESLQTASKVGVVGGLSMGAFLQWYAAKYAAKQIRLIAKSEGITLAQATTQFYRGRSKLLGAPRPVTAINFVATGMIVTMALGFGRLAQHNADQMLEAVEKETSAVKKMTDKSCRLYALLKKQPSLESSASTLFPHVARFCESK